MDKPNYKKGDYVKYNPVYTRKNMVPGNCINKVFKVISLTFVDKHNTMSGWRVEVDTQTIGNNGCGSWFVFHEAGKLSQFEDQLEILISGERSE